MKMEWVVVDKGGQIVYGPTDQLSCNIFLRRSPVSSTLRTMPIDEFAKLERHLRALVETAKEDFALEMAQYGLRFDDAATIDARMPDGCVKMYLQTVPAPMSKRRELIDQLEGNGYQVTKSKRMGRSSFVVRTAVVIHA